MTLYLHNVSAQEPDRIRTVEGRFASTLLPEGIPVGAMRLLPRLGVGAFYSDNVFANNELKESDQALLTHAEAVLRSDTSRYFAEIGARGELARFTDFDVNDFDNGAVWFTGRTNVTRASNIDFDLDFARLTEPRTSANIAPDALELTPIKRSRVAGLYNYQPGRWRLRLDGQYQVLDFDDVPTLTGVVNNDDRDREMLDFGARFGYDFTDTYGLFLEGRIDDVKFDQRVDNQGFERSYNGYEVRLGADLRLSGLIVGDFFVGYLSRDFEDPRFAKAEGPSYGADIDWVITDLTTLKIGGSRATRPTVVAGASTILDSEVSLGIDHELRRNLVLRLGVQFVNEEFEGTAREDDNKIYTLGAEYRMNKKVWLTAGYRYWDRDSGPPEIAGRIFKINEVTIDVTFQI